MLKLEQSLDASVHSLVASAPSFHSEVPIRNIIKPNEAKMFIVVRLALIFCDCFWWELGT